MNSIPRRSVLTLCASTPLIAGGCLERSDASAHPVRLCKVGIENSHTEPLEAELRIIEEDTVLFEHSEEVSSAKEGIGDGETTILGGFAVPDEELPTEPGHYTIQMRITGDGWEKRDEFSTTEIGRDQVSIWGHIENRPIDGQDNVVLGIGYITSPERCDTE